MKARIQIYRGFVVAYLLSLVALNAYDLYSFPATSTTLAYWVGVFSRTMRLALLGLFVWKVYEASRGWILTLGILLFLVAATIPIRLYLHSASLILVAGATISRAAALFAFSVAPAVCAICCVLLWIEFRRISPNQSTDPTLASGTPGAGHQSRHP
jgi:hypothetical protein